jgi:large subunit ribosomal protein L30
VRAVAKIKIKWVRSQIGFAQKQGQTIRALGLRRLQQTVEHDDSPTIRGMVHKIRHMVQVELVDQEGS